MLVESVPTQMVGNYFMRSRCQLITSPFWARYKKRTSSFSFSDVCGKMHECIQYNEIHLFIVCPCLLPAFVLVSVQGLSGSKLQLHREWETATATATGHGSVRGAWQHQQLQLHQQTCPTKSSVPRRLTLNFFHLCAASQVETRIVALCLKNTL